MTLQDAPNEAPTPKNDEVQNIPAPEWLVNKVIEWRDLFNLGDTHNIHLKIAPLAPLDNGDKVCGEANLNRRYLSARLIFPPDIQDDASGNETVLHEILHVVLDRIYQTVHRIIDIVPDELRDHALHLYYDAEEETITRITRALASNIKPSEEDTKA